MKKEALKNLLSILIAGVLLVVIILVAQNTDLFDSLDDMEEKITLSGQIEL